LTPAAADGSRAVLVHIDFRSARFHEELDEFRHLALSSGLTPLAVVTGRRERPDARFFVGSGKIDEVRAQVAAHGAGLVVFNHPLSPAQERNIEKHCGCRALDRIGLILDIFAQRARTHEGKLQVELAQLQHLATRLVRGWSHLERQKGGIGLRGPGETQLETDRRLIGRRIKIIHERLEKVRRQRQQGRRLRQRVPVPVVSLVGYTNAGKSTLFNSLTGAAVYAADKLFATLDPTLRQTEVPPQRKIVLGDTVGFIRHIPHDLIESFHATLEEVREADLLLHVVDAVSPHRDEQMSQVEQVIAQIGAADIPRIVVYNKIDLDPGLAPHSRSNGGGGPAAWVSAQSGAGVEELRALIGSLLQPPARRCSLRVPPHAGGLRARLFEYGAVRSEQADDAGWLLDLEIDPVALDRMVNGRG
jgi:GTP-binding protein HflX